MKARIKEFWTSYESKIVTIIGFVLVAAISFEFGLIQGNKIDISPIIIEKSVASQGVIGNNGYQKPANGQILAQEAIQTDQGTNNTQAENKQKCAFVGSKNSNKYHMLSCRWAKQIKIENLVCFESVENATAKGYLPDKNCIK